MTYFGHLRREPWAPSFTWVTAARQAADLINIYHEDYPRRVDATEKALADLVRKLSLTGPADRWPMGYRIPNSRLLEIHRLVFWDEEFAGKWRTARVRIGDHYPPGPGEVPKLMAQLEDAHRLRTDHDLAQWYNDFETIHPFQDGNGRVGGIIVAAYAYHFNPFGWWLAPNQ